jgi:hypothetical protein
MLEKKSVVSKTLTKELAIEFASMTPVPGERDFQESRAKWLRGLVEMGEFSGVDWHYLVDNTPNTGNGKKYRGEGQHSSRILADPDLPADKFPAVLATISEWTTDNLKADLVPFFQKFNQPKSSRTPVDLMGVGTADYTEISDISKGFRQSIAKGIAVYIKNQNAQKSKNFDRRKKKDQALIQPVMEHVPGIADLYKLYMEEERRKFLLFAHRMTRTPMGQEVKHVFIFKQPGVIAEMYDEWMRDSQRTEMFWTLVLNASHPDPDHETRVLADTLLEMKSASSHVTQEKYSEQVRKWYRRFTPASAAAA